jgi:hypothetical protein
MKCKLIFLAVSLMSFSGCRSKVAFGVNQGQIKDTRSEIESIIPEPERQEALLKIVEGYKANIVVIEKEAIELRQQVIELNRDYDTSREELELRYARLAELTEQFGNTVKVYSMKARTLCSEEEWKRIAPKKSEPFNFEF